jgi:3',5'-cyclic AMP phosphodiesterase CpdA
LLLGAGLLAGCELIEYSPDETRTTEAYHDLTRKNLEALAARPNPSGGDTLRFVFTGDSQRDYAQAEDLVKSVNKQRNIAFVVVAGDVSDFGLIREFRWMHDKLKKLQVPYLTVIGNHDQAANGRRNYEQVYGALNYSFSYAGTQFVLLDTNGREYNFNGRVPDVPWMARQLANPGGSTRQVVICHVPPMDVDFDSELVYPYVQALHEAPNVVMQLNGHRHGHRELFHYGERIPFINSYSFVKQKYLIVTIWGRTNYRLESVEF